MEVRAILLPSIRMISDNELRKMSLEDRESALSRIAREASLPLEEGTFERVQVGLHEWKVIEDEGYIGICESLNLIIREDSLAGFIKLIEEHYKIIDDNNLFEEG